MRQNTHGYLSRDETEKKILRGIGDLPDLADWLQEVWRVKSHNEKKSFWKGLISLIEGITEASYGLMR